MQTTLESHVDPALFDPMFSNLIMFSDCIHSIKIKQISHVPAGPGLPITFSSKLIITKLMCGGCQNGQLAGFLT